MGERYVALVEIHDQPPIDTQAKIETHTRVFDKDATAAEIWDWALHYTTNDAYRTIVRLEIRPDEGD